VSTLPSTIYLRSELAHQAKLKGCVAIPIQVRDTSTFYVALFYSSKILDQRDIAEKALETCRGLLEPTKDPQMVIPMPTPGDPAVVIGSRSVLSKSRSWLKCELALQKPEQQRASEDVEDIMKFTRRLEFFKHMAEGQRYLLCQKMTLQRINSGVVLHRSSDAPDPSLWRIVVLGRIAVQVTEPYGNPTYPVWHFDSGQTFSKTYLNLFISDVGIRAHIETVTQCQCLEVRIPPQMRDEFKAWTRPLWYEELTRYFGVSINEAGEALGMCTSAIKKICRRHGIARWPHRKIASVEKTIVTLQARIQELEFDTVHNDEEQLSSLRTELMDAVRQRMQCGCNRAPLPLSAVDDDDDDDDEVEKPARQRKGGKAAMEVESSYTGQHPVEFGIMQHQLADMHATVPIFDDDVTKNESPSDAPEQSPSRDPGVSPLPSADPSGGVRRTRSLEQVEEYDSEDRKRRAEGAGRHMTISEASSELMANMFGTAGLPAVGHWEFGHHPLHQPSGAPLFNHPGQPPAGTQPGSVGGGGWGHAGGNQGYSVLADSLVNSSAFGAEASRFPPAPAIDHAPFRSGSGGSGVNGGKGGGGGGHGAARDGDWNGAGSINGNGMGSPHTQPPPAVAADGAQQRPTVVVRGATVPEEVQRVMRQWNEQRLAQGQLPVIFEFA